MKPTIKAEQLFEQGVGAFTKRDYPLALVLLMEAIKLNPSHADALHFRGVVRLRMRDSFDALLHFEAALAHDPGRPEFHNNRGIAFADIGMFDQAELSYRECLRLGGETTEPHMGLGAMACHLNKLEVGIHHFGEAIRIAHDLQDAHLKRGVALLGFGLWEEGWREFDWRWVGNPVQPRPRRMFPAWRGEDLRGKGVVVYQEQGYGDIIMGLRFARLLVDIAGPRKVIFEVSPHMLRLARTTGIDAMVYGDTYPPGLHYSASMLDLAAVLGVVPEKLPRPPSYLAAPDHEKVAGFRERMGARPGLNIGVCWNAGRRPLQPETEASAAAKSMSLQMLRGIIPMAGANFYSLQLPVTERPAMEAMGVTDWMDEVDDFADTAALVEALDLVISVDTAVAHLAGALGKPVWNLVRWNGYWPWLLPGHSMGPPQWSLWYPSMTLYRQPALGDWHPALDRMHDDLTRMVSGQRAA
jgi:tetratricopeptide (TPR) repeat protein